MSKPFAGYPSRTAAALAFVDQGLDRREIAGRMGITTGTLAGLLSSAKRGDRTAEPRQLVHSGGATAQIEREVMNLWDAGKPISEIVSALAPSDIPEKRVRSIIAYMREGLTEARQSATAAKLASSALLSAIERVKPQSAPAGDVRPALSFEQQLALVASGQARVVTKIDARHAHHDQTFGGVGSSML